MSMEVEGQLTYIPCVFQDEVHIGIPRKLVNMFPSSLLARLCSVDCETSQKDIEQYIDYPSLSMKSLIRILLTKEDIISTLSVNEVINLYETNSLFFEDTNNHLGNDIEVYLDTVFLKFLKQNGMSLKNYLTPIYHEIASQENTLIVDGLFTESFQKTVMEYARLFSFYNICYVELHYWYGDLFPDKYIYPNTLHDMFPRLKEYTVAIYSYYSHERKIIETTSPFFDTISNQFNKEYYWIHDHDIYEQFLYDTDDVDDVLVYLFQIRAIKEEDNQEYISNDIYFTLPINGIVPNLINDNYKLTVPNIIYYKSTYDNQYHLKTNIILPSSSKYHEFARFSFLYENKQKKIDYNHPFIKFSYIINDTMLIPFFHLPICKEARGVSYDHNKPSQWKLEFGIPSLVQAFEEGIFDNIQELDFYSLFYGSLYSENVSTVRRIVTTHIFPNVTTITVRNPKFPFTSYQIEEISKILFLIRRRCFPQLYIFDGREAKVPLVSLDYKTLNIFDRHILSFYDIVYLYPLKTNNKHNYKRWLTNIIKIASSKRTTIHLIDKDYKYQEEYIALNNDNKLEECYFAVTEENSPFGVLSKYNPRLCYFPPSLFHCSYHMENEFPFSRDTISLNENGHDNIDKLITKFFDSFLQSFTNSVESLTLFLGNISDTVFMLYCVQYEIFSNLKTIYIDNYDPVDTIFCIELFEDMFIYHNMNNLQSITLTENEKKYDFQSSLRKFIKNHFYSNKIYPNLHQFLIKRPNPLESVDIMKSFYLHNSCPMAQTNVLSLDSLSRNFIMNHFDSIDLSSITILKLILCDIATVNKIFNNILTNEIPNIHYIYIECSEDEDISLYKEQLDAYRDIRSKTFLYDIVTKRN
ncbi:hypothetical protein WA158_001203 [Blastocystis sp. Blastoise]